MTRDFTAFALHYLHASWRERSSWSQTQGRNIDRMAEAVRPALVDFACGRPPDEFLQRVATLREQLDYIEGQVRALAEARRLSGFEPPTTQDGL